MRIAIIPARGGSKRIPKKNIISFCGKPMIYYALNAAKESNLFDCIHVSTDSQEICDCVESLGFSIDFMRDKSLADDFTGLIPVMKWVIDEYHKSGKEYDEICCIMPTAPLLEKEDLLKAFKVFNRMDCQYPIVSVSEFPVPVDWAFKRDSKGFLNSVWPEKLTQRSQDLDNYFYESGPFTIWNKNHLNMDNPLGEKILSYLIPKERAVDIDTLEDLQFAEKLFRVINEC
jgi:pseudaminic acid cytidylyltransferase